MPNPTPGYTFAPTFDNAQQSRGAPGATPQGSIKTLNFRLPRVTGAASANAISPLVGQDRRGSSFGGAVLQSVLRTVLGADQANAMMGSSSGGRDGGSGHDRGNDILRALSGGGVDSTSGWLGQERDLNRGMAPPSFETPPPVFLPGQESGEGPSSPPFQPPGAWIDPRPDLGRGPAAAMPAEDVPAEDDTSHRSPLFERRSFAEY